ncbi:hypothetical protein V501_03348 [Pseudogymnoascus sp. VKM F-4519 (FW-2642)]|nr:hypothetical protein V501_03348 [Pseudogymnoascus sp. VKM F-4519 (FW-2642)]
MSAQKPKALTYRVENIPFGTTKEQLVRNYFYVKDQADITVKSLVPAVETIEGEDGDLTATIMFHPHESIPGGPRVQDDSITVDKDFRGFTPVYVPPVEKGPIVADVIAVTGLAGHAFGSWAHSETHMWLRDYLPRDAPNARILTYGYHSKLQGSDSVSILQDHTNKFVHSLIDMREEGQCDSRPIIFIGHSLGCLIIKKTLTDAISLGINSSRIPVREIIFLAAPHRGLNITALQTLVKGEATEQMVLELQSESPTLTWLNQSFTRFARDIDILTCYETKPTKTAIDVDGAWVREGPPVMMVSRDSAQQFYPREKLVSADCDHSQIAKIKRGQNGIYPAVKAAVKHGLVSTAKIVAGAGAAMNESSRFESKFRDLHIGPNQSSPPPYPPGNLNDSGSKESAIEPGGKFPLAFGTAPDPVQEPSITLEAEPTSTTTTNPKDSSPPCTPKSKNADVLITSPTQLQERNAKESTYLAELDDDLKAMSREFNEGFRDNLKNAQDVECKRCGDVMAALGYHYSCPECEFMPFICQECYDLIENCRIHHKKLLKREFKPWDTVFGIFYVDPNVTTEDNELIRALKQNNLIRLRQYAQIRTLLDSQDRLGFTPLHVAAQLGLAEGTALLIECGALFETRNHLDHTPLHTAVDANQIQIAQILLDGGANIEITYGKLGTKALHLAASCVMYHIVTLLVRRGAEIDAPSDNGTPLCRAIVEPKSHKCVEALLVAGANVNCKSRGNLETPLILACRIEDHETASTIVDLLLRYDAEVDLANNDGYTPLMAVAEMGHLDACKSLLEKSPQLDIQSSKTLSENAIYFAARGGHEEILDLLIAEGASCLPTKAVSGRFTLGAPKWKSLEFLPDVTSECRKRILSKLRAAKHN